MAKKKVLKKKSAAKKPAKPAKKAAKKVSKPAKKAAKPVKKAAKAKPVKKSAPKKVNKAVKAKAKVAKPVVKAKAASKAKVVAKKPMVQAPAKKSAIAEKPKHKEIVKPSLSKPTMNNSKPTKEDDRNAKKPVSKKEETSSSSDLDDDGGSSLGTQRKEQFTMSLPRQQTIVKPNKLNPVVPKPQVNKDSRTRYSDKELVEFKDIILKKLDEAKRDYDLLKSTLSHKDDHGTDDTSPTFKLLEDGSDVLSKEETAQLAARQEKFIQNLQNALIRIENKTYGICRATGKLISKERLRSVPHATLSIDAKLDQARV